ncbi:serine hydrolase [Flavihumibacter solisilvae]|uniref:Beta-lactamase-related domain-containing protein n=1 Tax=Flavihumibacter solisilvae TaxID=1349421 RepID=A0A0C1IZ39_9BACT|nr:serine hydrolase [Flavihumibacter solisilvae]KIC95764.1 hypothetical protein OI18_03710 [Flavihumibacter solisilvae]
MKKIMLLLLTLGLAMTLFCQQSKEEALDALMQAYHKVNKFNGSVLVAHKGKVLLQKGYGLKNAGSGLLNDSSSIYSIYSITKPFTATLILQLVEQGKLSLSDPLSKFYPSFPKGDSITVEHLLTHTSGLYDYTRGNDMKDQTETSFIEFLGKQPLDFAPGTNWSYSNSGYWLLGFIIEKLSGLSYEEAMGRYLFKPLKMQQSGFHFKHLADPNKTIGYAVFSDHIKKDAIVYDPPAPYAAGAIYSTVGDLYKFHRALQAGSLLKKETLQKAYTPYKNNYGYGWITSTFEGHLMVGHSGGAAGYRSNLVSIPEEDICIILLNNHENAVVDKITERVLCILFDKPYKVPVSKELPVELLKQYAGAYNAKPSFTFYVTVEDGSLAVQVSKNPKTSLLAEKENLFYAEEPNAYLEFIKDENGAYNALVMQQRDIKLSARRIFPIWGITGTATGKGWNDSIPDLPFREESRGIWSLKNLSLKKGLLVFRLNNDWGYHYGDNELDGTLDMYGKDIAVEEGVYDIRLDLREPLLPTYTITSRAR